MSKGIYDTYYAFEVDLEKMEGRFLFNTGKGGQKEAEKAILERLSYKYIMSATTIEEDHKPLILDSSEVLGLTPDISCAPMGDTITTKLATEKGFICQVMPCYWGEAICLGNTIFVSTSDKNYPIRVVNTLFDI